MKKEVIIASIKKNIILFCVGMYLIVMMLHSGNELLTIIIPIVISEMIPRIYTYSEKRYHDVDSMNTQRKSESEELNEDSSIYTFYVIYISLLSGYFVNHYIFMGSQFVNIVVSFMFSLCIFIFLIVSTSLLANKLYN